MLLTPEASERLLTGGVDCIKVVVSGLTQGIYDRYHRGVDAERVFSNLAALSEAKRRLSSPAIVAVDYIVFPHNEHEIGEVRRFCDENGLLFGTRAGFTVGAERTGKSPASGRDRVRRRPCDWLWTIMTVGWQGKVLACANYTFTGRPQVMGTIGGGETVRSVWNGAKFRRYRGDHLSRGRESYPLCRECHYEGIRFQY
jgi:hypothetical protein